MGGNIFGNGVGISGTELVHLRGELTSFLEKYLPYPFCFVGSAGMDLQDWKPAYNSFFNDIDVAVEVENPSDKKLEEIQQNITRTITENLGPDTQISFHSGLRILSFLMPFYNFQVDLIFVPSLKFARWMHPSVASDYKNVYRNEILVAMTKILTMEVIDGEIDKNGNLIPTVWSRKFLDLSRGLCGGVQSRISPKTGKLLAKAQTTQKWFCDDDPFNICRLLNIHTDIMNLEQMAKYMMKYDSEFNNNGLSLKLAVYNLKRKKLCVTGNLIEEMCQKLEVKV